MVPELCPLINFDNGIFVVFMLLAIMLFPVPAMLLSFWLEAITTKVVSMNPNHGEVYSIQHYVIKFVSDVRQVRGCLHL
jgi:hypothetical protein